MDPWLKKAIRIEVVCTGNELLDGTIADTNTQRLALALKALGLSISKVSIVPDQPSAIASAVTEASTMADVIIVSGGLGPTSDDLTLEVSAHALGKKMVFDSRAKKNVTDRFRRLKRNGMNPSQIKQFYIPEGAKVLKNPEGTAPGLELELGRARLFFLPGVPREFDYLVRESILPFLESRRSNVGQFLFTLKVFGKRESELNEMMKGIPIPLDVELGYRTMLPENHIKIEVRSSSPEGARRKAFLIFRKIRQRLGQDTLSWADGNFEDHILQVLLKKKRRVVVAESCTGGLISSLLTRVAGSSQVFERGFVTYSNEAKSDLLNVSPQILERFGAVSRQTAEAMATGALQNSKADRALAVTGIAGPSGGTRKKPVGTVWIAVAQKKSVRSKLFHFSYTRDLNQRYSAYEGLRMLIQ